MNDTARHTIPRRLDDPERWLFWTVDEAAALMGPALLRLAANQFVPGLIAGVGGWRLLRRGQHRTRAVLSDSKTGPYPHQGVPIIVAHRDIPHPLKQCSLCQVRASG